jgi:hypothetical protein
VADLRDYVKNLQSSALTQVKLEEIIRALVEADVAVIDARSEKEHWMRSFAQVQAELKAVLAVVMMRYKLDAFEMTSQDVMKIPSGLELHVGDPEPKVRRYEFKPGKQKRSLIETDVTKAMRRH